jgi:hypothetical protein
LLLAQQDVDRLAETRARRLIGKAGRRQIGHELAAKPFVDLASRAIGALELGGQIGG